MLEIHSIEQMQALQHPQGARVGFVPTMGYLHEGHLSLVKQSKKDCDVTIVSIFVNPSQFGPNEDLESYPRDIKRDLALLEDCAVDYVFFPESSAMYPTPYHTWVEVEELSRLYCGASRPGHFRGVCTVVLKLLNIVKAHRTYMGEKDFQQLSILRVMLKDLNLQTRIIGCPIVREADGLAKSSRNIYLKNENRKIALCLYNALSRAKAEVASGERDCAQLINNAVMFIDSAGAKADYVAIVSSNNLQALQVVEAGCRMLIAAYVGKTRLIDNIELL
jgi:pantoate--beta-alanine ligase